MSAFYIDGSLQVPDAELSAVAGHHVVTSSEWLGPRIQGLVEELRQRRADAATQRLVVKELQAKIRARLSRPSLLVEPEGIHAGRFFAWLCDACAPPLGPLEFIPDVGGAPPACAVCDAPKPQRPCTAEQLTRALRTRRERLLALEPYVQHIESCQVDEHANWTAGAAVKPCTCGLAAARGGQ